MRRPSPGLRCSAIMREAMTVAKKAVAAAAETHIRCSRLRWAVARRWVDLWQKLVATQEIGKGMWLKRHVQMCWNMCRRDAGCRHVHGRVHEHMCGHM